MPNFGSPQVVFAAEHVAHLVQTVGMGSPILNIKSEATNTPSAMRRKLGFPGS